MGRIAFIMLSWWRHVKITVLQYTVQKKQQYWYLEGVVLHQSMIEKWQLWWSDDRSRVVVGDGQVCLQVFSLD